MESNEIRRGVCACSNSRMHTFSRDISVFCETVCLYHVQTRQRNVYPSNVSRDVDMQHDLCKHVSSKIHSKGSRPSKAVSSFTSLRFRTLEETLRDKDSCSIRNLNSTIRNEKRFFPPPPFFFVLRLHLPFLLPLFFFFFFSSFETKTRTTQFLRSLEISSLYP